MFGASYCQRHTTSSRVTRWWVPLYAGRPIHFATGRSLRDYSECRGTDESFALLGCYAGYVSSYSSTFRDRLSVPSSSPRKSKTTRTSGHVSFIDNIYLCMQLFSLTNSRDESKAPEISWLTDTHVSSTMIAATKQNFKADTTQLRTNKRREKREVSGKSSNWKWDRK